jgi:hypothetical protein
MVVILLLLILVALVFGGPAVLWIVAIGGALFGLWWLLVVVGDWLQKFGPKPPGYGSITDELRRRGHQ